MMRIGNSICIASTAVIRWALFSWNYMSKKASCEQVSWIRLRFPLARSPCHATLPFHQSKIVIDPNVASGIGLVPFGMGANNISTGLTQVALPETLPQQQQQLQIIRLAFIRQVFRLPASPQDRGHTQDVQVKDSQISLLNPKKSLSHLH